jgi:hypothetical protein
VRILNIKARRKKEDVGFEMLMRLKPVEVWMLLLLRLARGELCCKAKMMELLFLVERVYGVTGAKFKPGPWSKDVEEGLKRLKRLGLVEEEAPNKPPEGPEHAGAEHVYRLTEAGREAAEKIPVRDMGWEYPYIRAKTFIDWDVGKLARYIYINYPEHAGAAKEPLLPFPSPSFRRYL